MYGTGDYTHEFKAHGDHNRESDSLELELCAVVSWLVWMLGTELWSSLKERNMSFELLSHLSSPAHFF